MNSPLKCQVRLTDERRRDLERLARDGGTPARKARYARLLLHADSAHPEGCRSDAWIAAALGMHVNTVARVRKDFVAGGEDSASGASPARPRRSPPRSTAVSRPTWSPSAAPRPRRAATAGR